MVTRKIARGAWMNPAETGFFYLNSRYYDPETGRFISADAYVSTGQGVLGFNMYAYCRNNPATRVDIKGTYDKDTFEANNPDLADGTPDNDSIGAGPNAIAQTSLASGMGSGSSGGNNSTTSIVPYYPPNNGAVGETTNTHLMPGTVIDRYGTPNGHYFSNVGTPTEMRALPPSTDLGQYNVYEVV